MVGIVQARQPYFYDRGEPSPGTTRNLRIVMPSRLSSGRGICLIQLPMGILVMQEFVTLL
jgi:hypothetical protein